MIFCRPLGQSLCGLSSFLLKLLQVHIKGKPVFPWQWSSLWAEYFGIILLGAHHSQLSFKSCKFLYPFAGTLCHICFWESAMHTLSVQHKRKCGFQHSFIPLSKQLYSINCCKEFMDFSPSCALAGTASIHVVCWYLAFSLFSLPVVRLPADPPPPAFYVVSVLLYCFFKSIMKENVSPLACCFKGGTCSGWWSPPTLVSNS